VRYGAGVAALDGLESGDGLWRGCMWLMKKALICVGLFPGLSDEPPITRARLQLTLSSTDS